MEAVDPVSLGVVTVGVSPLVIYLVRNVFKTFRKKAKSFRVSADKTGLSIRLGWKVDSRKRNETKRK
jgi:hypothetical protein